MRVLCQRDRAVEGCSHDAGCVTILSTRNPLIDRAITDRFNGLDAIGNDDGA